MRGPRGGPAVATARPPAALAVAAAVVWAGGRRPAAFACPWLAALAVAVAVAAVGAAVLAAAAVVDAPAGAAAVPAGLPPPLLPPSFPPAAYAAVTAQSVGYEKTTVVEFYNSGPETVETFRMWLSGGALFKSFKTEKGWTGARLPQGVLVFTAAGGAGGSSAAEPGQTVKFGIKTDTASPTVNWRALDGDGEEITLDATIASGPPSRIAAEARAAAAAQRAEEERIEAERLAEEQRLADERQRLEEEKRRLEEERRLQEQQALEAQQRRQQQQAAQEPQDGVLAGSEFRLVPGTPHVDATVRIVGEGFGPGQPLTAHMGEALLAQFTSDQSGRFVATAAIPQGTPADRVEFAVRDADGRSVAHSVRLAEVPGGARTDERPAPPLVVEESPGRISIEGALLFRGTGDPGASITITIADAAGSRVTAQKVQVGQDGAWSYGMLMPASAGVGNYTAVITDGIASEERSWQVADDARVTLESSKTRYEPGDTMRFAGRAAHGEAIAATIENPRGVEIYSESVNVTESGDFSFGLPTTVDSIEGTYIAFAFQGDDSATAHAGLGEPPKAHLAVRSDRLNYQAGDLAVFAVDGPPGATVTLTVLQDKDEMFASAGVLNSAGRFEYPLDLFGYESGVYTAVVSHATSQDSALFSVGLAEGSGQLTIQATKQKYKRGEPLLLLGTVDNADRVLVTLTLIDPGGETVSSRQIITERGDTTPRDGEEPKGKISVDTLRVPSTAAAGEWTVRVESGSNFKETRFEVVEESDDSITLFIEEFRYLPERGIDALQFRVIGADDPITIAVIGPGGEEVGDELRLPGRSADYQSLWPVPEHLERGEYTMSATAGQHTTNATFAYPPAR